MKQSRNNSADPKYLRDINRMRILNLIRSNDHMSRVEIARIIGLSKPTVSAIVEELMESEYIKEEGKKTSNGSKGRKRTLLKFQPEARYCIAMKIDKTGLHIALTDLSSKILRECKMALNIEGAKVIGQSEIKTLLTEAVDKVTGKQKAVVKKMAGIGVGVAGLVENVSGELIYSSFFPQWQGFSFKKYLHDKFAVPVYVEDDIKVETLGEKCFGQGLKVNNLLYISVAKSIASGLVLKGRLYRGANGYAGEIGHTVVVPGGSKCACGLKGCLNTIASEDAIIKEIRKIKKNEKITIKKIIAQYSEDDKIITGSVNKASDYLAVSIANMINIYDPHTVVISGTLYQNELLFQKLKKKIEKSIFPVRRKLNIVKSSLGNKAGVIGAASLAIMGIFHLPELKNQKEGK